MGSSIVEIVFGAVIAILITIVVENVRKPKLSLTLANHHDVLYRERRPAQEVRFLALHLRNGPLHRAFRWMTRSPAQQCYGSINFYHLDGQNVFGRSMRVRWSGSPEPVATTLQIGEHRVAFIDGPRLTQLGKIDVFPGETERLDVAARFDNDVECYGWSNDNYFSDPIWRTPLWKLGPGRYLVKVSIFSSGEKIEKLFRLINDVPRDAFRLEDALQNDRVEN